MQLRSLFPDVNECLASPCLNQGTCENNDGSYNCRCVPGWEGQNCEIGTTPNFISHYNVFGNFTPCVMRVLDM